MPTIPHINETRLVESLILLANGEVEADFIAETLNISLEALVDYLDANPHLMAEAEAEAARMRSDPDFAVSRGIEGLNAVVAALAGRVKNQAADLNVAELATTGNLLEKLVGIAETRKAQARSEKANAAEKLPLYIQDTRANPVTKEPRFTIWLIHPDSPHWVDFADLRYQEPHFDWLQTFAPLSPETGNVLAGQIEELLSGGARYMDAAGRIIGG